MQARYHLPGHEPPLNDGCTVSVSCLICPLSGCRYDEPMVPASELARRRRNAEVVRLAAEGLTNQQIAERMGMRRDKVSKIVAAARRQEAGR